MSEKKTLYIACDFDGTLTTKDSWPLVGDENPHAVSVLKRLRRDGHFIILHTCRQGKYLKDAIEWMRQRGVAPDAVNENPESIAIYGPQGPKMNASFYIDDKAFGIKKTALGGVDWKYIKRNYKKLFNC